MIKTDLGWFSLETNPNFGSHAPIVGWVSKLYLGLDLIAERGYEEKDELETHTEMHKEVIDTLRHLFRHRGYETY